MVGVDGHSAQTELHSTSHLT